MTHALITRLVVGEPATLALGQPVGQTLATPTGSALRWRNGTWVGASTPRVQWIARLMRKRQPQSIVVRLAAAPADAARRRRVVAAAIATVAVGAAIPVAMLAVREDPPAAAGLPVAPAAATASVRVVSASYVAAQPSVPSPETQPLPIGPASDGAAPPLPFAPPAPAQAPVPQRVAELPKAAPTPVQRPAAAPSKPAVPKEAAPAPKTSAANQREQQPVSAVVLDDSSLRAARAAASPPTQAPARPAPAGTASVMPAATQAAPKPALERGNGLIAITPDGKLAVFTNPKTRLPQQFKIGDQLPGGDTIRSIDAKQGKVVSSSKEYTFD